MVNQEHRRKNEPVAYKLSTFVGREREKNKICESLRQGVKVVFLSGEGGIGKTRLLEELPDIVKSLQLPIRVLSVVDFYNTSNHIGITIEEALLREIEQRSGITLPEVEEALETLDELRRREAGEDEFHEAFVRAFNAWVDDEWAVLRFDTAEFLEYGRDDPQVLKECEVTSEVVPAVTWIRQWLSRLDRVTAFIASRPSERLHVQLRKSYSPEEWTDISLDQLSLDETEEYFQKSEYGQFVDSEMVKRIWILTDGRPILISLAIDWLARGIRVDSVYDVDVEQLGRWKKEGSPQWKERVRAFEEALVIEIRYLDKPIDAALYYAARARKGFNAQIIQQLLQSPVSKKRFDLNDQEIQALMDSLERFSFVKRPYGARAGWLFLHDEMYELIDKYIWWDDYPKYSHQAEVADFLASTIYGEEEGEGLIADADKLLQEAKTGVRSVEIAQMIDVLKTEQLFYQLEADPQKGYELYERANTQAISRRNQDWDDMLRIEILRFLRTLSRRALQGGLIDSIQDDGDVVISDHINRGCRARWVHRFFARGELEKAERVARRLLDLYPDFDIIWQSRILTSLGATLVRNGEVEAADHLQEAIANLQEGTGSWMVEHYRGTAQLYLGLGWRARGYLFQAAEAYQEAQEIFRENEESISAARALNNLAYVWSRQGQDGEAISAARQAVEIRRRHGDIVGTALSYNTLAIAERRAGAAPTARHHAREALGWLRRAEELEGVEHPREVAMIHLNLGQITRYLAARNVLRSEVEIERDWERAEDHLREAEKSFKALEPYYQFELYNQFGTLYSRWANWVALYKLKRAEFSQLISESDRYFRQADKIAISENDTLSRAENLEDMAWNFHLRRAYIDKMGDELSAEELENRVFQILEEAKDLISQRIDADRKGVRANYIAGGIRHQLGRYYHKFTDDLDAAFRNYALAVALFDQFSEEYVDRRERVMEHIQKAQIEYSKEKFGNLIHNMLEALDERDLEGERLRHWIHDAIADVNLWIKEQMGR